MKNKQLIFVLVLSLMASGLRAQGLSHIPAAFLDIGFGARAQGMGGAFVASVNDVHAVIWNPAGLTRTAAWQGTFSYTKQLGIIPYGFLASSGRIDHLWAHGEAVIVAGDELMREMRFLVAVARDFHATVNGLSLGMMLDLRQANFGRNATATPGAVSGEAYGLALNLGFRYQVTKHLVVGGKLQDLFNTINWSTTGFGSYFESTPRVVILGLAAQNIKGFNLEFDLRPAIYSDLAARFNVGLEKSWYQYFVLRAGLSRSTHPKVPNTQYAVGAGLQNIWSGRLGMDLAYVFHELENFYRISMIFKR
ncbi:hypothetical protein L0128_03630 [candidate division KSB1 bacterium]|nr:hypothetical protein [candidate division KSB1 bacterium]